jgi:hypothetical protein
MGGARAFIASFGAGISLIAGAAISLLFLSLLFAYDGITDGIDVPAAASVVVVDASSSQTARARQASPATPAVTIRPPAPAAQPAKRAASRPARTTVTAQPAPAAEFNPGVRDLDPAASTPPAQAPATHPPAIGDGVRDVGDAVSATVQGTGKSAGAAAAPLLGPPVTKAVQDVLDVLTAVLQGATGALGGVLDAAVPQR